MSAGGGSTVELSETRKVQPTGRRERAPASVPALTILCHPDLSRVGERVLLNELLTGRQALLSRNRPEFQGLSSARPLADLYLSREPICFSATADGIRLDLGNSPTPVTTQCGPLPQCRVFSRSEVDQGVVLELAGRVVLLLHRCTVWPDRSTHGGGPGLGMIGNSSAMVQLRADIRRVADLDVPVLLRGETGTGKELAAQAIHRNSPRRNGPLVSVNLGSITPSLAVAELFGAARGAYTGAVQAQQGYFQRAHGGTIFLDEVGEAPSEVQVMLLRVLETGEIQPVGKQVTSRVDVRVVAATDSDLESQARLGNFREPLIHRLSGYLIWLPPLRQRRDDIGSLMVHFMRQELKRTGETARLETGAAGDEPWLPASLVSRLACQDWPGNIRQLRNVSRQLVIGSRGLARLQVGPQVERLLQGAQLQPSQDQDSESAAGSASSLSKSSGQGMPRRKPSEISQDELLKALRSSRWDLRATARRLQVSRTSLYRLVEACPEARLAENLSEEEIRDCHQKHQGDLEAMVDQLQVSKAALRRRIRGLGLKSGPAKSDNR